MKKSLLISNMLDPLTKDKELMINMLDELKNINFYSSIETRPMSDIDVINKFNEVVDKNKFNVTIWITGNMSRSNKNLSSLIEENRQDAVNYAKSLIDQTSLHRCDYVGIASGLVESYSKIDSHINSFKKSIVELIEYIRQSNRNLKIVIEPLDYSSHKNNVIGKYGHVMKLINLIKETDKKYMSYVSICWDSAHVALNGEDLIHNLEQLSPYISRIHFSDAILDKGNVEFGDNHREFDGKGLMNKGLAKSIIRATQKCLNINEIFIACEVRTKKLEDSWKNEEIYRNFLSKVISE